MKKLAALKKNISVPWITVQIKSKETWQLGTLLISWTTKNLWFWSEGKENNKNFGLRYLTGFWICPVGFEPTTTEFRSDALTNWAIRPWVQLALRANFVRLLQFHHLFSVEFHFNYYLHQSPRLFWLKFSWGNHMSVVYLHYTIKYQLKGSILDVWLGSECASTSSSCIFLFWTAFQRYTIFLKSIRISPIIAKNLTSFINFNLILDLSYFEGRNLWTHLCKATVTLFVFLFSGALLILHHLLSLVYQLSV